MNEKIYLLKKLDLKEIKQSSPLDKWLFSMVQKTINDLSLKDISCMLRQELYLDISIPKAWDKIIEHPFCGEMYDGELLKLLMRIFIKYPTKKDNYKFNLLKVSVKKSIDAFDWANESEKQEYIKLFNEFEKLFLVY